MSETSGRTPAPASSRCMPAGMELKMSMRHSIIPQPDDVINFAKGRVAQTDRAPDF